jgi:hypothetical protein
MIQREYPLVIASGTIHSTAVQLLPGEWLAGFRVGNSFGGNLHIEDGETLAGPFRTCYDRDDKQFKWTTLASGAYHIINGGLESSIVRFTASSPVAKDETIFLRVTQKNTGN